MKGHLIQIDALTEGMASPLRLASGDVPELCHLDGTAWEPNIARLPTFRYDFFGGEFASQIVAPQAAFVVSIDGIDGFQDRVFADARFRLWEGEVGDAFSTFELLFDGLITGEPELREGLASFSASANDAWLDDPLLGFYAGTGSIEADEDKTGQVKPLTFGHVRFADAVLIDAVGLIYQVNDGPVADIAAAYDRAAALGASTGDYANYAALEAATVPNGGWATCNALGIVRLASPPDGRVAFDVEVDARKPGEVIAAIAELAGGTVSAANLAALDIACPYNQQIQITAQTTARAVIQEIADSVGAVAGVSWTGTLFVQPLAIEVAPPETLDAEGGSDIAVAEVAQLAIAAPFWRMATEAEPSFVVYALGDVASGYNFRGTYAAAQEYRLDDVVFAADGRAFVYVNTTPASGNAPPTAPGTSNSYWSIFGVATAGAPSGTTVAGRDADLVAGAINASGEIEDAAIVTVGGRDAGDISTTVAAGGGVDTNQVSTTSIQADAVTAPYYVATGVEVMSTSTGTQSITGLSWAATVPTGEGLDIDLNIFPLWAGSDGTRFSLDAYLMRDGVAVETFGQCMDTNDMATNNQGGFAVPVGLFARIAGNGISSTYSVDIELKASRSESNSGGSKTFVAPLDFRLNQAALRGRKFAR